MKRPPGGLRGTERTPVRLVPAALGAVAPLGSRSPSVLSGNCSPTTSGAAPRPWPRWSPGSSGPPSGCGASGRPLLRSGAPYRGPGPRSSLNRSVGKHRRIPGGPRGPGPREDGRARARGEDQRNCARRREPAACAACARPRGAGAWIGPAGVGGRVIARLRRPAGPGQFCRGDDGPAAGWRTRPSAAWRRSRRQPQSESDCRSQRLWASSALLMRGLIRLMDHQRLVNLLVSNVPGPPAPMYFAGARVLDVFQVGVVQGEPHAGRGGAVLRGELNFDVVADAERCPDVALFAEGLENALDELGARAGTPDPARH